MSSLGNGVWQPTQYYLLKDGYVVNAVLSSRSIEGIREANPGYEVKRESELSSKALEAYQFWSERP